MRAAVILFTCLLGVHGRLEPQCSVLKGIWAMPIIALHLTWMFVNRTAETWRSETFPWWMESKSGNHWAAMPADKKNKFVFQTFPSIDLEKNSNFLWFREFLLTNLLLFTHKNGWFSNNFKGFFVTSVGSFTEKVKIDHGDDYERTTKDQEMWQFWCIRLQRLYDNVLWEFIDTLKLTCIKSNCFKYLTFLFGCNL